MRVKLKDITKFSKGTQINGKNLIDDGAYSYLNGGINPSGKWNEFNVAENTVTISEGGNSSGYVNYMSKAFWCGAHCYYLYDGPKNSKYLYYALKSQQERLFRIRSGACMPNIKKSDLGNFIIEYEEDETRQEEVVKVLEKCELLIEDYNKKLALLDEAVKARFVEMFGDPVINSCQFPVQPMTDICDIIDGDRGKNYPKSEEILDDGYCLFLNAKNVTQKGFDFESCNFITREKDDALRNGKLLRGDVVLTTRGTVGNLAFYSKNVPYDNIRINSGMVILRMNRSILNEIYFIELFKMKLSDIKEKIASGSAQPQLPISTMNKIVLMIPPLELQNQFASFVKEIDKSRSRIQKSLEASQELFDSLMQEYFG